MWQSIRIELIVTNDKNAKLGKSKHWQSTQYLVDSTVYWEVNVKICRFYGRKPQRKIVFLMLNFSVHIPSKDLSHVSRIGAFLSFRTFYRLNNSPFFSLQIDTLIFLMPDRTASWEIEPNFHSIPSKTPLLRIFVNVICARPNTRYKLFGSWLFGYASRG